MFFIFRRGLVNDRLYICVRQSAVDDKLFPVRGGHNAVRSALRAGFDAISQVIGDSFGVFSAFQTFIELSFVQTDIFGDFRQFRQVQTVVGRRHFKQPVYIFPKFRAAALLVGAFQSFRFFPGFGVNGIQRKMPIAPRRLARFCRIRR